MVNEVHIQEQTLLILYMLCEYHISLKNIFVGRSIEVIISNMCFLDVYSLLSSFSYVLNECEYTYCH